MQRIHRRALLTGGMGLAALLLARDGFAAPEGLGLERVIAEPEPEPVPLPAVLAPKREVPFPTLKSYLTPVWDNYDTQTQLFLANFSDALGSPYSLLNASGGYWEFHLPCSRLSLAKILLPLYLTEILNLYDDASRSGIGLAEDEKLSVVRVNRHFTTTSYCVYSSPKTEFYYARSANHFPECGPIFFAVFDEGVSGDSLLQAMAARSQSFSGGGLTFGFRATEDIEAEKTIL